MNSVQPGMSFEAELGDRGMFPDDDTEVSAFDLRMKLVALQRAVANRPLMSMAATYPVDWTAAELWALDAALWRFDYGVMTMGPRGQGGTPLFTLISKVWDGLIEYHKDSWPEGVPPLPRRLTSPRHVAVPEGREPAPITEEQKARLREWDAELGRTFE